MTPPRRPESQSGLPAEDFGPGRTSPVSMKRRPSGLDDVFFASTDRVSASMTSARHPGASVALGDLYAFRSGFTHGGPRVRTRCSSWPTRHCVPRGRSLHWLNPRWQPNTDAVTAPSTTV